MNKSENKKDQKKDITEFDLEMQKMKMKAQFGAKFGSSDNIPKEMEMQWLKSIQKFEEMHENPKMISVRERLGNMEIIPLKDIDNKDIENALDKLLDEMEDNGISLTAICEVEAKELYRFICEELLNEEVEDMRETGYTCCYTYEDFHPNDEYDIEHTVEEFINFLCEKKFFDMITTQMADTWIDQEGKQISQAKVVKKIESFNKSYKSLKINEWKVLKINIENDKRSASLDVEISYNLEDIDSDQTHEFKGMGNFGLLKCKLGYWGVNKANLPNFKI